MKIPAHFKYVILTALLLGASINMVSTTQKILQSSSRLEEAKEDVLALQDQKKDLEKEIEYKSTTGYIERMARDKLNMILPEEEIYLYPLNENEKKPSEGERGTGPSKPGSYSVGGSYGPGETPRDKDRQTPLQEWLDLFF